MAKILRTLRNNWKKSVFLTGLSAYGIDYGQTEYKKNLLMREYCQEAVNFGDAPIKIYQVPRHVVVILNPASNKKKAMKEYTKYCAPILHLSGASVTLLTTDDKNNGINLVSKVPDNADALIIAGGDGTISDVVTGLLRRFNADPSQKLLPIGILPLGKTNSVAKQLYDDGDSKSDSINRYRIMLKAAYSIVRETTKNISAMEIKNIDDSDSDKKLLPVYAVHRLRIGAFRDADSKIDKYWYFGKLRSYASYLLGSYDRDSPVKVDIKFSSPCSGCSKCYTDRLDLRRPRVVEPQKRWWHVFIRNLTPLSQAPVTDYSKIDNPSCGIVTEKPVNTVELNVSPAIVNETPALRVNIGPEKINYIDFVKEGWRRNEANISPDQCVEIINAQTLFLNPKEENDKKESWLSIDNEEYEFKKLRIELLQNILPVFILPQM
ncbi:hypothetical protein V9T40_013924 [Parthenolecanium corni]|uniref:Acylglycerol kinase, mitochondrial n=1 Tax=Parthenolecanium corni TaxID=536013 RepID=A0AAN9TT02_9HEMI